MAPWTWLIRQLPLTTPPFKTLFCELACVSVLVSIPLFVPLILRSPYALLLFCPSYLSRL
ncbi:hypothetical protein BJX66DRAFT_291632 [Aspergillus keveii]|uniref:Uncharacterized protein n=1 Tax=Aspergillus keveii TaxID=714993 RepID=A0ABR4GP55_9EURO